MMCPSKIVNDVEYVQSRVGLRNFLELDFQAVLSENGFN